VRPVAIVGRSTVATIVTAEVRRQHRPGTEHLLHSRHHRPSKRARDLVAPGVTPRRATARSSSARPTSFRSSRPTRMHSPLAAVASCTPRCICRAQASGSTWPRSN